MGSGSICGALGMPMQLRTALCVPSGGASGSVAGTGGPGDPSGVMAQHQGLASLHGALSAGWQVPALCPQA